ncbi:MAG: dipicolinate synthase subunit DpsA [Bacillota bacterium]
MKIAILGGDKREKFLADSLAKKGYDVRVLANVAFSDQEISFYNNYKNIIKGVDIVYIPLSGVDENNCVKKTFITEHLEINNQFLSSLDNSPLFLVGLINDNLRKLFNNLKINYVELNSLSDLAILNAIPTAEGAINFAIEKTPYTLFESNILLSGLGKVGLTLAWRLKALGANLYVVTRAKGAISRGRDLGFKMISYNDLENILDKIDIIFNTVPKKIFEKNFLDLLKKDALIIDLASSPGGIDFSYAKEIGINAFLLPGIPGKIAPETAANFLKEKVDELAVEYFSKKEGEKDEIEK